MQAMHDFWQYFLGAYTKQHEPYCRKISQILSSIVFHAKSSLLSKSAIYFCVDYIFFFLSQNNTGIYNHKPAATNVDVGLCLT